MDDVALERLEMKVAFLERANQELSDVVYRQQREIAALRTQMLACQRQLETVIPEGAPASTADEKPPHY